MSINVNVLTCSKQFVLDNLIIILKLLQQIKYAKWSQKIYIS